HLSSTHSHTHSSHFTSLLFSLTSLPTHHYFFFFFFTDTATTEIYTLSLHDALPIYRPPGDGEDIAARLATERARVPQPVAYPLRSEEHTSELQSRGHLVCRLLLEKKKNKLLICIIVNTNHLTQFAPYRSGALYITHL